MSQAGNSLTGPHTRPSTKNRRDRQQEETLSNDDRDSEGSKLVVVESPAKARTIGRILGRDFQVAASMGHVRDLPPKGFGVDLKDDFRPTYEVLSRRKKIIGSLRKKASKAPEVYLATDLDREGEAIAWHLKEALELPGEKVRRVTFHEITRAAIRQAFASPRQLDLDRVNAQQARRILDRIVGYQLSPLLWDKIRPGLSAGRVQSVAVRLIAEREREIRDFVPEEFWKITVDLRTPRGEDFQAQLTTLAGEKVLVGERAQIKSQEQAEELVAALRRSTFTVSAFQEKERQANAPPPFTTSLLQQGASIQLRFSTKRTMRLAQQLYEGVALSEEGPAGLITYMRTDSFHVADGAVHQCRETIAREFGAEFVPEKPRFYKSRPGAQAAHEAIRPTDPSRTPDQVRRHVDKPLADLYELIWRRFLASQMAPAIWRDRKMEVAADAGEAGPATFTAEGKALLFAGYLRAMTRKEKETALPVVAQGAELELVELQPTQHFTEPPRRYSEASLVRELERQGIGRPSTYAPIISTIQDRGYVELAKRRFHATELGELVTTKLVAHFPDIINVAFTRKMEEELDKVEEGELDWVQALRDFNTPFQADLAKAKEEMQAVGDEVAEGVVCELCGSPMVYKLSRGQRFLGCQRYPDCKFTMPVDKSGKPIVLAEEVLCDLCGGRMRPKSGRRGVFLACENYPECKNTRPLPEEEARRKQLLEKLTADGRLPRCEKCGEPMDLKMGPRGPFLGCSAYPKCKSTMSIKKVEQKRKEAQGDGAPEPEHGVCPECGEPLVERTGPRGKFLGCSGFPECRYTKDPRKERARERAKEKKSAPKDKSSDEVCEKCGKPMVEKTGRFGKFLACTGYPECRNTRPLKEGKGKGKSEPPADKPTDETCPDCGQPLALRRRGRAKFLVCTGEDCSFTKPFRKPPRGTGVPCPEKGCDGELVERRSRRGRFFGCSNYPRCRYTASELPSDGPETDPEEDEE